MAEIFNGSCVLPDAHSRPAEVISAIAQLFEEAVRGGADEDIPEGSRFVLFSDTLAVQLAEQLRAVERRLRN